MQWIRPKLNWESGDFFYDEDYNRIKNNIMFLHYLAIRLHGDFDIMDMGEDKAYGEYFYADEINKMLDNIEKINKNTVNVSYGQKPTYRDNGRTMTYTELNVIENNIVDLFDRLSDPLSTREIINVQVSIDKPATFTYAIISCVDETDASKTMSAKVTKSREVGFSIIGGHRYHLEYSNVEGFKKPTNTSSKIAVAKGKSDISVSYTYDLQAFRATINVTCPNGVTLTCVNGDTVYTQTNVNGQYSFIVYKRGTWTITIKNNQYTTSTSIYVATSGQTVNVKIDFPKIYGISRRDDSTSSTWSRTDNAVSKTATASTAYSAGRSDFNDIYPWSEMKRQTFSSGDVMVKIPEFWYKRYVQNDIEYIQIADKPVDGFEKHPGSGCFVGAYKTSYNFTSITNSQINTSQDTSLRANARARARTKGHGWGILDIATISAIQMLYLVEFANSDSQQAIGDGMTYNGDTKLTGTCDNVPGLTGASVSPSYKSDVVYRGIEGLWGNYNEWIDGLNLYGQSYYISTDINNYNDNTTDGYVQLSYRRARLGGCISRMGVDSTHPWVILPVEVNNSSQATNYSHGFYYNDECVIGNTTDWYTCSRGGHSTSLNKAGLFHFNFSARASMGNGITHTCRLLYKP